MTTDQPATPADDHGSLRENIGYRVFRAVSIGDTSRAAALKTADEILRQVHEDDAAPRQYELPAEPDGPLWHPDGRRLDRIPPPPGYTTHTWTSDGQGWSAGLTWRELLGAASAPLSTTPPTTTEEAPNA
jgi:hypothetical protein